MAAWKTLSFATARELEAYLIANSILLADIADIYFDSVSGKHVLVFYK